MENKKVSSATLIQSRLRGMKDRTKATNIKKEKEDEINNYKWLKSYDKSSNFKNNYGHDSSDSEDDVNEVKDSRKISSKNVNSTSNQIQDHILTPNNPSIKKKNVPKIRKSQESVKEPMKPPTKSPDISEIPLINQDRPSTPSANNDKNIHEKDLPKSDPIADAKLLEIDKKLNELKDLEQRVKASEEQIRMEARRAEEKMLEQIRLIEEKTKEAENQRKAQEELLKLAVGPLSHRSPYSTVHSKLSSGPPSARRINNRSAFSTAMSTHSQPIPSARSAKEHPLPPDAPKLFYQGNEWIQLWDYDEQSYYWWCEKQQKAQWEQPGTEHLYQNYDNPISDTDSGYESAGAMTDYSTDHENSYFTDSEAGDNNGWQEYWDEQAQAKYWYNNVTVSFKFYYYFSNLFLF